jgi:hypothetical protein
MISNIITQLLILLLVSIKLNSQISIGISIGGIGYHPIEDRNSEFYKWKLDKKGKFIGYAGTTFFLTYRINENFGVKVQQSIVLHDCAGKFAGITHVGLNLYDDIIGLTNERNEISASIGPFLYYRKNWSKIDGYTNNPKFNKLSRYKKWETKFVWHGGQIEYLHLLNENNSLSLNILPGYPYLYTLGIGYQKSK